MGIFKMCPLEGICLRRWFLTKNCDVLLRNTKKSFAVVRRHLSHGEVSTALRPFYFSVHPDLFGQHPNERAVNENSLKQLNAYIELLQMKRPASPAYLHFYLRSQGKPGSFQKVRVTLAERDLRKTVLEILRSCGLPTSYVDAIPSPLKPPQATSRSWAGAQPRGWEGIDLRGTGFENDGTSPFVRVRAMENKIRKSRDAERLLSWLEKYAGDARKKAEALAPVKEEVSRLQENLKSSLQLLDVRWDCGWNISHFRGCLQSFGALARQHVDAMDALRGRILVFGSETGVTLDGHVMLNSSEVRNNWLDLIRNVKRRDAVLARIPAVERAVSRVLMDIRIVHRKFQPKVTAEGYERHLRRLATSLGDYRGRGRYPKEWPPSLKQFQLVVETESGPLMLSPTGQFIVPASIPAFLLVSFISDNMVKAMELLHEYQCNKHLERGLHAQCMKELGLTSLEKDDNITPALMISCCERLLPNVSSSGQISDSDPYRSTVASLISGLGLRVTHYYSILSHGEVCIPWDWKP
ncbi:T-cell activation inhibitor, mitochondrial [Ischnura elegans]|uniref:T-cell activation inhibitor, mitochondrial n=1 Tax=Ischnura elegans TaxID=197161 RepID=UPI001ED86C73|nr:T-cell activation inhibitor, mitochondrial [Ischnura elegans]